MFAYNKRLVGIVLVLLYVRFLKIASDKDIVNIIKELELK